MESILVTGAKTGKSMGICRENIGLILEMTSVELADKLYPVEFTRICFKNIVGNGIKYADCTESVEAVIEMLNLRV